MACPSCNASLEADARFCLVCGHRVHPPRPGARRVPPLPEGLGAGTTLYQLIIDEAPVDWRRGFVLLGEMCSALADAHAQRRVHRDMKPEDVFVEYPPGTTGVVRFLDAPSEMPAGDAADTQFTGWPTSHETLAYLSPEELMGKPIDGRSNIYTLGILAYELITGQLPFPDAKGAAGIITAQLKLPPPAPSSVHPTGGIPPEADAVLLRCLEKDLERRYADVTSLARAVANVVQA